jgi:hypothetical protein
MNMLTVGTVESPAWRARTGLLDGSPTKRDAKSPAAAPTPLPKTLRDMMCEVGWVVLRLGI